MSLNFCDRIGFEGNMQMVSCSIELQKKGVEYNVIFIYKRLLLDSHWTCETYWLKNLWKSMKKLV